ncbi:MAG TPA: hypothetical protein VFB60_00945 [Ktedonobacteraceae bacterium]|nr:hypothetical protein [Ktedonobacteraceae bacterium]
MTYPLVRSTIPRMFVRRERWPDGYGVKAVPLVYPGQEVLPDQPVLRFPATKQTDTGSGEVVPAGLRGRVVEISPRGGVVIESPAALVQGVIGAGKQIAGILTLWREKAGKQQKIPAGAILVVPDQINFALLHRAMSSGVSGIVAGSISLRDLEGFLRVDLIQLLNCADVDLVQAHLPPLTLLFTEGLGAIAMSRQVTELLEHYQGSIALLCGATSVRHRIFPELVISLPAEETQQNWQSVQPEAVLVPGALVQIYEGEHRGTVGTIDYVFTYQQVFASGIHARAVRVALEDGTWLTVPIIYVKRLL